MVGDGVQELRRRIASAEVLELIGIDAVLVDADAADVGFEAAETVDGPEIRRRLDGGDVARVEDRPGEKAERIDVAAGDHQLTRFGTPSLRLGETIGEDFAKPGQTRGW